MKKFLFVTLVVLVAAGGVGYLVTSSDLRGGGAAAGGPAEMTRSGQASASAVPGSIAEPEAQKLAWETAGIGDEAMRQHSVGNDTSEQAGMTYSSGGAAGVSADIFAAPTGGYGPKIIKTAYLTVEVPKDGFENAWDSANMVAHKYNGFIVSSSSAGEKSRSGQLLIRVPSAAFDQAMNDLHGLGDAEKESVNGQEVTDQFVDLNARLRSWEAQQRVLLRLMDKANSISETMTVQREIQQVQVQIEQIKGQLRMLRDQTAYGTIQLSLHEPGAVIAKPEPSPVEAPSLATAWAKAWAGFLSVLSLIIVGLGYLIPLGTLGLIVWLIVRRFGLRPQTVSTR